MAIDTCVLEQKDYIVGMRRYFHAHPEVSLKEFKTSARIEEELDKVGIEHTRVGETGVYARVVGKKTVEGKTKIVALRADMDALGMETYHRLLDALTMLPRNWKYVVISDNDVVERGVLENRFDVGFISRPPLDASLKYFVCFRDDFVLVASPRSPLIAVDATEEDFSLATWIMDQEEGVRNAALRWLQSQGISVSSTLLMNTMGAIKRAVATGLGLSVLPYLSVREEIQRGDLVELRKDVNPDRLHDNPRRIYAVFKPEHPRQLLNLFFEECGIRPLESQSTRPAAAGAG